MVRGTTPNNTFELDIDLSSANVYITYSQTEVVFEKTNDDLTFFSDGDTYTIETRLTQDDTLALKPYAKVRIQIRAIFENDIAVASEIMEVNVTDVLKDGTIDYE